ncbi:metallophosphatase binding domain protein [Shewanella sp. GutCb]|uniref:alkaline phosphatase D family protein n=1 Tax=Shewanella sp. GutCb TaxID=2058315 RepID=UPI000C7C98B2|nr:alkaline phosphatase D family protein [Shewanella sp. GutCb]PKG74419.1 metallophosphatase binding domain protein [Shewanella sp. GutCb]
MSSENALPLIIAGPSLRHCDQQHFTLWFVSRERLSRLTLTIANAGFSRELTDDEVHIIELGQHAFQYLICVSQPELLPRDTPLAYQLSCADKANIFADVKGLTYNDSTDIEFIVKPQIDNLLHGSCRNPHHHSGDALVAADTQISQLATLQQRPSLLMLSGDQVYVDDIAGPMIYAIGEVISLLGLTQERFNDCSLAGSEQISYQPEAMYQRHINLLPKTQYKAKTAIKRWYINHPIFTSSIAENHLVSLNELIALYLLSWSPELWELIDIPKDVSGLSNANTLRWQREWTHLLAFKSGLQQVRRLFAHIPTYMIFDDHDITDDWNLTARWELAAYNHPFSKRIIGNALIAYTLFQGLGNAPTKFDAEIRPQLDALFKSPTSSAQDALIDTLLSFEHWHYSLDTSPKLIVLDTRTRRWRSESNLGKPSGLMDWEALMEFQAELVNQPNVIIVSPAPMYGVKLIETIQKMATWCGASLLVDAENWMAHPGTANTLLSIFQHRKTPEQFVILSGDVHYSFSYDISIRFRDAGPAIYQITCSGIKNQFPEKLLPYFDKFNGWLYGYFSPLNFLTKRKRMSIRGRRPNGARSKRLMNKSGIGRVELAKNGAPTKIAVLHADMSETEFLPPRHR